MSRARRRAWKRIRSPGSRKCVAGLQQIPRTRLSTPDVIVVSGTWPAGACLRPARQGGWRRPRYSTIYNLLSNPAYAGAYAYGKTEHTTQYDQEQPRRRSRRKPKDQWWALIPNTHEGYLSWEQFQEVQQMMTNNAHRGDRSGAARRGLALLAGL